MSAFVPVFAREQGIDSALLGEGNKFMLLEESSQSLVFFGFFS
jgi:hypothetical protein